MKNTLIIFAAIASLFSASLIMPNQSYANESASLPSVEFSEMRRMKQAKITEVISPVTVLLDDGSIARLSGINVPNSIGEDISPLAVTARDILKDLLVGKRVDIYQTKDKKTGLQNRMGHDLVHIERNADGAWAQGTLLALGLARVKTDESTAHTAKEMLALENQARTDKQGIWADEAFAIIDANNEDNAEQAIGGFAIVEGAIESVALKKNRIYVNFGKDWKTDFTVSIAPEHKRSFSNKKLDPMNWGGQRVRVRGSVREYNGAYMEITHPESIEFLVDPTQPTP